MSTFTNIDDFTSNSFFQKYGFLKESRFNLDLDLGTSQVITEYNNRYSDRFPLSDLAYNTVSVTLPGFTLQPKMAPHRMTAINRTNGRVTITFLESAGIHIKRLMYTWINMVAQEESDDKNYERFYPEEYFGTIKVSPLGESDINGASHIDVFDSAFPVGVADNTMDVQNENNLVKMVVTFAYKYHRIEEPYFGF